MPLSDEDQNVKKKAVDQIMKLIHSQLALEKKQAKMDAKDKDTGNAATRMADLDETIEKLVALAKKKGYIDAKCTVASLKSDAAQNKEKDSQDDAVSLMTAMKKNLDAQTTAVTEFMKDRVNHDAEWEENAWAKLLNSNQDILVLMQRLHEKNLITQDMINMATLPDKPPAPRENDMKGISSSLSQQGYHPNMEGGGSMMGQGHAMYGGNSSMMGGVPQGMQGMGVPGMGMPGMTGSMMQGMHPGMMQGMHPGMMQGMHPGMMQGMHPGMMNPAMMNPAMMNPGMMHQHPNQSFMSKGSKPVTDLHEDSSSNESEEELNARLRELKGMDKERAKKAKLTKAEQDEENLFKKNKGVGQFNNNFKVADDIRTLGAVPEEEEEREVPIDKHMAKAMEERLLKGIEEEMLRDKKSIIRSFMKDNTDSYMGGSMVGGMPGMSMGMPGTGMGMPGSSMQQPGPAQSVMQMQMMQQQNMMALQQMLMQMNMRPDGMGGSPSMMGGGSQMPGYHANGSMMGGSNMTPSMMGQQVHPGMLQGMQGMQGMPGMPSPQGGGMGAQQNGAGASPQQMGMQNGGMGNNQYGM